MILAGITRLTLRNQSINPYLIITYHICFWFLYFQNFSNLQMILYNKTAYLKKNFQIMNMWMMKKNKKYENGGNVLR